MINKNDLCIECGICSAICPNDCISLEEAGNHYLPKINNDCVNCGLCQKVCPMQNLCDNHDSDKNIEQSILGSYKHIYFAKTKDEKILVNATSGGVVTQIVKTLLNNGSYNKACLIEGYNYENQLVTKPFGKNDDLSSTQKSRYLTISHKNTCEYILNHPEERVIIVGTGCAINGIQNFIKLKKLNKENYLFVGLICDKTMNYGVYKYFKGKYKKFGEIKNLYFRTKDNGGWPGGVRLEYKNECVIDLNRKERMAVKEYFMPECCLYCLNKLNSNADIVLGDNYIKEYEDKKGASSVLVRTDKGEAVIDGMKDVLEIIDNTEEEFLKSLVLTNRERNIEYAKIKGLLSGTARKKYKKQYRESLRKIKIGNSSDVYRTVQRDLNLQKIKKIIKDVPKFIFSIKNKNDNGKKQKVVTVLGIKFRLTK